MANRIHVTVRLKARFHLFNRFLDRHHSARHHHRHIFIYLKSQQIQHQLFQHHRQHTWSIQCYKIVKEW